MNIDINFEKNILFNILKIIWKRKIVLLITPLIVSIFVGMWTKKQPKIYSVKTTAIMPITKQSGGSSMFGNFAGGFSGISNIFSGSTNSSAKIIEALLKSNRMKKDMVDKFDLKKIYNIYYDELLYDKLSRDIKINYKQFDEIFEIRVKSINPILAVKMANFHVENLEKLNDELKISVDKKMIQILDPAYVPSFTSGPFVKKNIQIAYIFTLTILLLFTLIYEYFYNMYTRRLI